MSWFWLLFGRMSRAPSVRSPSLRVNFWRRIRRERCLKRSFAACLMHRLMARGSWWFLSREQFNKLSIFCGLGVPSCV
jgi:hypothetical protein